MKFCLFFCESNEISQWEEQRVGMIAEIDTLLFRFPTFTRGWAIAIPQKVLFRNCEKVSVPLLLGHLFAPAILLSFLVIFLLQNGNNFKIVKEIIQKK